MPRKWLNINRNDLFEKYAAGVPLTHLQKDFGLEFYRLKDLLKEAPPRILKTALRRIVDEKQLVKDFYGGLSTKKLAEKYSLTRATVDQRLRENEVLPRTRRDSMLLRMSQTSKTERMRLTEAAHTAVRGSHPSLEVQIKTAKT